MCPASVAKVRAKARPWRSIFALLLAIAGAIAAEVSGVHGWGKDLSLTGVTEADRLLFICGQIAFLVFGLAAAVGLSGRARWSSQQLIGQAHAGVLRYLLVLVGVFAVLTFSLALAQHRRQAATGQRRRTRRAARHRGAAVTR